MFNMQKMLKQVQKLQEEMARVQEELARERVEASAGGGVVRAVANGQGDLVEIAIDPSVVDPSDVAMLQDLVLAAAGEAIRKARDHAAERMKAVTGGLQLPGMPGLPGLPGMGA
ncbi:MAG: YbaB/EbfC family nucleoid-associated protein [Armatimonadetes bacterium 13_1_40CM_3_65_7]|nr:MAG: YbaB/EbfC family nucleoid-associated protein [Armatimonadetes bacterium 13_1_40CM_3_65_7]